MIQIRIGTEIMAVDKFRWSGTDRALAIKLQLLCREPLPQDGDIDYSAVAQVRQVYRDLVVITADPPEYVPGRIY